MRRIVIFAALLLALAACSFSVDSKPSEPRPLVSGGSAAPTIPQQSPAPIPSATPVPTTAPDLVGIKSIVIYVGENHSRAQVKAGAPKIWKYAQTYGYLGKAIAATHPSLGNYIAMIFGDTFGIKDDKGPGSHKLNKPDVLSGAWKNGRTAKEYPESMGSSDNCRQSDVSKFKVKHAPWQYSTQNRALCEKYAIAYKHFATDAAAGSLPNIAFVVPNICNDAHDCSVKTFDTWVDARIKEVQAGPQDKAGDVLQVVAWDEDNRSAGNEVLTVMIHPSIQKVVAAGTFTHYSLCRAMADMGHSPRIGKCASAPDMLKPFNLIAE